MSDRPAPPLRPPATPQRRTLPAGGDRQMLAMADGHRLRVEIWRGSGRGRLLLLGGRGDFVEKYCELIHELVAAGFTVAAADWRGQGRSGRLGNVAMKGHCRDFAPWLDDLGTLVAWLQAGDPGPWSAIGHSMGGHLLLRWLGEGGSALARDGLAQTGLARAVLLSPMLGVRAPPFGPVVARMLAQAMVALGRGDDWVVGGGPYRPASAGSARQRMLTSDAERYPDEAWWMAGDAELGIGAPTWGWLAAAFRSMARLTPAALGRVTTPLLILTPEQDGLVDVAATRRAAALIPDARLLAFAGAGHELPRESDAVRKPVLAAMIAFLAPA